MFCGDCQMRTTDEYCREEGTGASVIYRPLPAPGMKHRDCVYERHKLPLGDRPVSP